jgi:hypothetical protein
LVADLNWYCAKTFQQQQALFRKKARAACILQQQKEIQPTFLNSFAVIHREAAMLWKSQVVLANT